MCIAIIWNNSFFSRRTRPVRGSNRSSATANVTLYCTWRPSGLTIGLHGQGIFSHKKYRQLLGSDALRPPPGSLPPSPTGGTVPRPPILPSLGHFKWSSAAYVPSGFSSLLLLLWHCATNVRVVWYCRSPKCKDCSRSLSTALLAAAGSCWQGRLPSGLVTAQDSMYFACAT